MAENGKEWDPKDHVVLAEFPEANYAVLFLRCAKREPYVAAYGYDHATRSWAQGHYCDNPVDAWNRANPAIIEHLSGSVTYRDLLEDMHEAGCTQATEEDAREFAEGCARYTLLADCADAALLEESDILSWWECNRSEG